METEIFLRASFLQLRQQSVDSGGNPLPVASRRQGKMNCRSAEELA
jgi:hypothetical protein